LREIVLQVPSEAVERVLDQLLPIAPEGVREIPTGDRVELRLRGPRLPPTPEIARAVRPWGGDLIEREVPDDWRERRRLDFRAEPIADRLVVRPEWAPAPEPGAKLIDIALVETSAFGAGTHPTTSACLELILELEPAGSFADLGCGSGVLAILAAKLGFQPVLALDVRPESVAAASGNAALNGVAIDVRQADLTVTPAPMADVIAANVGVEIHRLIAAGLAKQPPRTALVSGFGPDQADAVVALYAEAELRLHRQVERMGWIVHKLVHLS
jgi:ribosomal protein L11 methyltransferase